MNKKGIGIIGYALIIFLLISIGIGITLRNGGIDVGDVNSNMTWPDVPPSDNSTLSIGINKVVNTIGWIAYEVSKEAMQWGAENPDIPWRLLIYLLFAALLAPLVLVIVKLIVIIVIFIKDFFQSRRERKEIKRLRTLRYDK